MLTLSIILFFSCNNAMKEVNMYDFEFYIFKKIKNKILEWRIKDMQEVYVLSFFIYDDEDDPRKPTLTFGYNTMSNYHKNIEKASNAQETKWNYAFWLQNEEIIIARNSDIKGIELRNKWITNLGLMYSDIEPDS